VAIPVDTVDTVDTAHTADAVDTSPDSGARVG
jgi:hypothetical protein